MRVHTVFFLCEIFYRHKYLMKKISCVQKWDDTYMRTFLKKKSLLF